MRKKVLLAPVVAVAVFVFVGFLPFLHAKEKPAIPFVGMSMTYHAAGIWTEGSDGEFQSRAVCVMAIDPVANEALVRDTHGTLWGPNWLIVDLDTNMVTWLDFPMPEEITEYGNEFWISTDVGIGDHMNIIGYDAEVIGETVLSVEGKNVDCWVLQGYMGDSQDTWYYEKTTGLWIAAAWFHGGSLQYPDNGWGGHLASTNVPLP